jgi:hypothetical protein
MTNKSVPFSPFDEITAPVRTVLPSARNFTQILQNAAFLGLYLALLSISYGSTRTAILTTGLAGSFLLLSGGQNWLRRILQTWSQPRYRWLAALLLLNWLLLLVEPLQSEGFVYGAKSAVLEFLLLLFLAHLPVIYGPTSLKSVLMTLVLGFIFFGLINLIASKLGLGNEYFLQRTDLYVSRFNEGGSRWAAPLWSSWQLSGLLRWAAPVLAFVLVQSGELSLFQRAFLAAAFVIMAYLLLIIEFRAALFPIVGWALWQITPTRSAKAVLCSGWVAYVFITPIVWTNQEMLGFVERAVPDSLLGLAGNQDFASVLSLSQRTEIWAAGIDSLLAGNYTLLGVGHSHLNAYEQSAFIETSAASIAQGGRSGFHQGFLDLIFIYGLVPSVLFGLWLANTCWNSLQRFRARGIKTLEFKELDLAFFCLGMVALSNCHDGFLNVNQFFFYIAGLSLITLRQTVR